LRACDRLIVIHHQRAQWRPTAHSLELAPFPALQQVSARRALYRRIPDLTLTRHDYSR
jgi:hypothetical protein